MRKLLILVVLAAAVVSGVWLALGAGATGTTIEATPGGGPRAAAAQVERVYAFGRGEARAAKLRDQAAARAVMQRRITEQLDRRAATRTVQPEPSVQPVEAGAAAPGARAEAPGEAPPLGQMLDRSGNRGYLMRVMNEDLIPLADECYALAREGNPELAGMMAVDVDLVGDEDVGGVVEDVKVSTSNEIKDEGLLECVRESLMAVTLPPPEQGGRDGFMLSMRFAPEE